MSLFFLTFFTIYGGLHAYAFLRARTALGFGPVIGTLLTAFMLAMTLAPFLIRQLENREYELAARTLSFVGYTWMAVLFLFFCSYLFIDVLNLMARGLKLASGAGFSVPLLLPRPAFLISLALSLGISGYGYVEALSIRTERLTLETEELPAGVDRLRIVQISDVHLGLIVRCSRLDRILAIVKDEKPDLFVSTGDLVDGQINHLAGLAERLREIQPKYGKYAITGNHEYYAGLDKALAFTREAGFTLLRNEARSIGVINIAGVNDPTGVQMGIEKPVQEKELLSRVSPYRYTLLLKHRPKIDPEALGLFDLQLSGHTHKGQIFPFTLLSALSYPMNAGRFDLPNGSVLYTSRGSGTWGPPIRFLSPPMVTVVDLLKKSP